MSGLSLGMMVLLDRTFSMLSLLPKRVVPSLKTGVESSNLSEEEVMVF
jgi:hypothetical protein